MSATISEEDDRRSSSIAGHRQPAAPQSGAVSVYIFHRDIDPIQVRPQRQRLPVHRRIFRHLGQQFRRHVYLHRVFEGLHDLAGEGRDPAENIHRSALHAVLVDKGNVAIFHLDRDRHQHRVAGHPHKISAHIKRHQVHADLVADHFFQVLELHRGRFLQFVELFQAVKLFGLLLRGEWALFPAAPGRRR